jgi:HSP20 family protein
MDLKELVPWHWGKRDVPVRRNGGDPLSALESDIDRAFDLFWRGFDRPLLSGSGGDAGGGTVPRLDMRETDKQVEVTAELPGMDADDVEVSLADGTLTIRGEKKVEREKDEKGYILRERSFGRIERTIPLPDGLDLDHAEASFKNGILTVAIPKTSEAQSKARRITVQHA